MGKAWRTLWITWCAWEVWVVSGALELSPRGFLATNGCGNCHACTPTPVESPTEDRRRAAKRIATACATNNCTEDELAIVLAIAMQESDSMDKTDTSKTGLAKNVSPFNLNLAELALLGCDAQCANGLGQNSSTYNLQEATYWLLKGLRGTGAVGSTDDFLNYHRGGSTGWRACKGKGSGCDCVPLQCRAYRDAIADAAMILLKQGKESMIDGERVCEDIKHVLSSTHNASNEAIVLTHVKANAKLTFKAPKGFLRYKYLIPSGPYPQLWDWDSMFMGVGMLQCCGSRDYLVGSMLNFLDHTNLTTGQVQGCLLPSGETGTIFHAKPVVLQGAWLACGHDRACLESFRAYQPQMKALLDYWLSDDRIDEKTGLPKWYNQLESGQDNLPLSSCASSRSSCWNPKWHELVLVSADLGTFLYRELQSYALFLQAWGGSHGERQWAKDHMASLADAMNTHLWDESLGFYTAWNTTKSDLQRHRVVNRVDVMGFPLFAKITTKDQVKKLVNELLKEDMLSSFGIRSTSSLDPRYNNRDEIKPYSNWQGPVWVNANAMISYGLLEYGYQKEALMIASRVVDTLAADLRTDQTWHEGYNSETGAGLAADGFLSWDTLGANWLENLRRGVNPFLLAPAVVGEDGI